eukprot:582309-Rhodomonas_salina.1
MDIRSVRSSHVALKHWPHTHRAASAPRSHPYAGRHSTVEFEPGTRGRHPRWADRSTAGVSSGMRKASAHPTQNQMQGSSGPGLVFLFDFVSDNAGDEDASRSR